MGMSEAVRLFFARYFDFEGRSRRAEYWWAVLGLTLIIIAMCAIVGILAAISETLAFMGIGVIVLFQLGLIIPGISLVVRRMHDQNLSGLWYLVAFIPIIGGILLLYYMCIPGTKGPNRFGPDPKGHQDFDVFA